MSDPTKSELLAKVEELNRENGQLTEIICSAEEKAKYAEDECLKAWQQNEDLQNQVDGFAEMLGISVPGSESGVFGMNFPEGDDMLGQPDEDTDALPASLQAAISSMFPGAEVSVMALGEKGDEPDSELSSLLGHLSEPMTGSGMTMMAIPLAGGLDDMPPSDILEQIFGLEQMLDLEDDAPSSHDSEDDMLLNMLSDMNLLPEGARVSREADGSIAIEMHIDLSDDEADESCPWKEMLGEQVHGVEYFRRKSESLERSLQCGAAHQEGLREDISVLTISNANLVEEIDVQEDSLVKMRLAAKVDQDAIKRLENEKEALDLQVQELQDALKAVTSKKKTKKNSSKKPAAKKSNKKKNKKK